MKRTLFTFLLIIYIPISNHYTHNVQYRLEKYVEDTRYLIYKLALHLPMSKKAGPLKDKIKLIKRLFELSKVYNVDRFVALSILMAESEGYKYAISTSNARGYMQILPNAHWKNKPVHKLFNMELNLNIGLGYLSYGINRKGITKWAISGYNKGYNSKVYNKAYVIRVSKYYKLIYGIFQDIPINRPSHGRTTSFGDNNRCFKIILI